jgi:uncharacterized protein (DUF302 family)
MILPGVEARHMLQQTTSYRLSEIPEALQAAVERHGAQILAVSDMGNLLRQQGISRAHDAHVFTICLPELYAALLAADIRFAAFLPCRIAACSVGPGVTLETMSPIEYCRLLHRPDLDRLAQPLETALRGILTAVHDAGARHHSAAASSGTQQWSLGATETQVNVRGSLPQRIDCRGTKVEDLAGTGKHDAAGG